MDRSSGIARERSRKRQSVKTDGQQQGIAAVERALAILGAFRPDDAGTLSLADLSVRTGLHKSAIARLVQPLVRYEFLQRREDGGYQVGTAPLVLAAYYYRSLRLAEVLMPIMQELAKTSGQNVSFYVHKQNLRMCLLRVESARAVRRHVREGDLLPLNKGSGGRVLQAFSGVPGKLHETVRMAFCYVSLGERDPEVAGISAPVFDAAGGLAGTLTLAGPRSHFVREFVIKVRPVVLRAVARATSALGGDASSIEAAVRRMSRSE